jgi:hypothetical protein
VTVSGQVSLYQKESPVVPAGAVKVCETELSPFVGFALPSSAHQIPPWQPEFVTDSNAPAVVQPDSVPVSKPPFTTPPPPLEVTVRATVVACVALVPVPVTVSEYEPAAAEDVVEMVSVDDPPELTAVGLRDAVTPEGAPATERAIVCAEPLTIAVLMVEVPELPAATLTLTGLAEIEKSLTTGAVTVSETAVEWLFVPSVPVTVRVEVPVDAAELTVMVRVEEPPEETEVGLRVAVTPVGAPETARVTVPEAPTVEVLIVELPLPPRTTETLAGLAAIVKSGAAVIGRMQLFWALENSSWMTYVWASDPVKVACCALQISPISPLLGSYQASGGPFATTARPTSASVIVSIISCDATDV